MSNQPKHIRVVISGGGTGGHIFPALAIAHALRQAVPDVELLFVGAEGKMEMEKVPAAGYTIVGLPIQGIKRELSIDNLSFPIKLVKSLRKAGKVIRDFQPDVAVGVGGYASGPLLFMASQKGVPTLIQEQNSYPGITNRLLSKKAAKVCVAYDNMEQFFEASKVVFTGNPVRDDIRDVSGKRNEAAAFFGLDPNKKTILVVGGSQGARSINRAISAGLQSIHDANVQLLWQTGKLFHPEAEKALANLHDEALRCSAFISRMDLAYALADVVVTRAGASTVSELCLVQKPAIMVPLPTAAEDHQTKNCLSMVERNAAILVKDTEASTQLVVEAIRLIKDEERCKQLALNMAGLGKPNAASDIAQEVLKLVRK